MALMNHVSREIDDTSFLNLAFSLAWTVFHFVPSSNDFLTSTFPN